MNGFHAQYFYLPSTTQGNPGGLNNDNEYPNGSGLDASWTSLLPGGNSSPTWSPIDTIPFNFNFNGSPVSTFKVSSSGVLTFTTSSGIAPIYANASIPDPGIPNNSIMVWGIEGTGSNDEIVTKTFGNPGGQQYWVFFSSYTAGSWSYWSIVFEEGTDKIYIVDQRHSNNATPQITAGIQIDNSNAIMVTGSPQLANVAGTNASPADNHYYEFIYGSQNSVDMSATNNLTYPYLYINDAPYVIAGVFDNLGIDTVTSMDINYSSNNGNVVTETISNLSMETYATDTFSFATLWNPTVDGNYDIAIWASNINGSTDLDNSNDTIHKYLHVFSNTTQRKPMLETFVSSTSQYSVTGNVDLHNILSSNTGNYTLLKYQMSWPNPGDPYYTVEGGQRRSYYGINTVPRLVMNGVAQNNPIGFTQAEFDESANLYSFIDLSADYSVGGQVVDINVQINPIIDAIGVWNNLVLHAAIFEYTTYNNAATNGEFEFYNVMKKMVPDISGTSVTNLAGPNNPQTINLSYTFNGQYVLPPDADSPVDHSTSHTVESFNNLGVAVWLQDVESKYVLQSTEASLVTNLGEENKLDMLCFPNPSNGAFNLVLPQNIGLYNLEVYDLIGNLVYQLKSQERYNQINLEQLNAGIYQLKIQNDSYRLFKKIELLK